MRHACRTTLGLAIGAAVLHILGPGPATAQQPTQVTGRVTDAGTGQPVPAVQLQFVGTSLGVTTNDDGRFTIRNAPAGQQRLRALRVGYAEQTRTITVTPGVSVAADFALQSVTIQLAPVVTTATGEQRRVEVGNAIAQLQASTLVEDRPITSVGDLLTSRVAGVQAMPANQTGVGTTIRIRGTTSLSLNNAPIYIIDGVRMESAENSTSNGVGGSTPSRVGDINPEEIESIEVVRGPSAATLYGTDAANGVIVLTTKRGRAGAAQWTLYGEHGLVYDQDKWPANFTNRGRFVNRAGTPATDGCYLYRQALATTHRDYCVSDAVMTFNPAKFDGISPFTTGNREQYGSQLRGGTDATRYFLSGEWEREIGPQTIPSLERQRLEEENVPIRKAMVHPNVYRRGSARANLNITLPRNADIAVNLGYVNSELNLPQSDNNASAFGPTLLAGTGNPDPADYSSSYGFYNLGNVYQEQWSQTIDRFIGSSVGNYRPRSWLSVRGNAGLDYTRRLDSDLCRNGDCPTGTAQEGFKLDNRADFYNWTVDLGATGNWNLTSRINTKTSVGVQFFRRLFDRNSSSSTQLPPGATSVSAGAVPSAGEATDETRTLGAFIEQSLALNDRLFITGAVRTDDNSAFGADFDAVYYPKVSVSWVLSEESFLPRPGWLDQLRLRTAYGASGQQPGTTDALQFYTPNTTIAEGVEQPGVIFNALGNTALKPERSAELEAGIDWTIWRRRINGELTYYDRNSRDALIQRVLPPSVGTQATTRYENLGKTRNYGWEWLVNAQVLDRRSMGWSVGINGSHNTNKLVQLGGVPPIIGNTISQKEGYPLNAWWVRPLNGFADANDDGIISVSEVQVGDTAEFFGYSTPRTQLSLNTSIELFNRRIRLSALADRKSGHKVWNGTELYRCISFSNCRALHDPTAPLDDQARAVAARLHSSTTQAGYIEDATFVRLREIALNLDLPDGWAHHLRARRVGLNIAARNLGVWTDYTGMDPESNYGQDDVQSDFLTIPPQRYYVLRLNLGF